jgi:hypothetical protein
MHCIEPIPKIGNKNSQKRNCAATVQFPHSCVCERLIQYTVFPRSICIFYCRKYDDRSWEYIKFAQRHMNAEIGTEAVEFPVCHLISLMFHAFIFILKPASLCRRTLESNTGLEHTLPFKKRANRYDYISSPILFVFRKHHMGSKQI